MIEDVPDGPSTPPDNPKVTIDPVSLTSSDLMQKLLKLEKARKEMDKNGTSFVPPHLPPKSQGVPSISSSQQERSHSVTSLVGSIPPPGSFVRGTFKSKSARTFARPKVPVISSSVISNSESRSQPTSPTLPRKSYEDKTKTAIPQ